ncbi:MAG: sigma-70 family RNA polymerase sigma factor [Clostridia bacterium]|nr:sigma-70 family RNA polymerase sigma factor [Clostridia bacterium]
MQNDKIQNHLDFLLSAAMAKCGNLADAQDLTQETVLSALVYLEKGGVIENMRSWLIAVMKRKYYDLLRRKYALPTVTIGEDFELADESDIAERLLEEEEMENVRREVTYLADSYRTVIAKHYFHGKSIKEIAAELGLAEGTVKSRLDFGRKQIKKGFENMEKYAENSYMPQYLAVRNSGRFGLAEEPMSLTEGDTLAQNLLILAYEKPLSITELSRAIGVASAYVEPIVKKLVDGELMKRTGDGKVYTDFIIYRAEDYVKYIKEQEAFAEAHLSAYTEPLKAAIAELKATDFYSLRLERFMAIDVASEGQYLSLESVRKPQIFPERPNGGRWIAFGTIYPQNYVIPEEKRGREEYGMAGKRNTVIDKFLNASCLKLCNYETSLDKYSWLKHSGFDIPLFADVEFNMLKLFYLLKHGIAPETVDLDTRILKGMPLLEERGFISTKNGKPEVLVPCLTHEQSRIFASICKRAKTAFADNLREPLRKYCETHKKSIPAHLTSVPEQKLTMPYEPPAMAFVYEAIKAGVHVRDLGEPCPETIAIFD